MRLKRVTLVCCLLLAASPAVEGQAANRSVALLARECEIRAGVCGIQHLVRFRFQNGELVSKDTILVSDTLRVRYELGRNHIYRDRYVITNWGDVIDVQSKELLHEGVGEYIGAEGDRIFHRVDNVNIGGYFYYDLQMKRYARLRRPGKWALPGLLSPDQTKSVEGEAFDIWLYSLKRKRKLLGSNFFIQGHARSSGSSRPPLFWLDDDRILTQRNNGEVVILRVDGTVTPVVKIPIAEPAFRDPQFFRDGEGRIVYVCSEESFAIDVEGMSYTPYRWLALGSGFEAENERNPSYGHIIRYRGQEIGRLWASVSEAPTIDGYIALEYGDVGSNLGYPKGLQVWNITSGKWSIIDVKPMTTIVGWIEE